ncbi:MAG: type II toxin-antitoxin system ParD family antitoxin [Verrucomicrobiota bacterium]
MAEGINVRLTGKIQDFVKSQSDPNIGKFNSSSEFVRHLIRRAYEESQDTKVDSLFEELEFGLNADESAFIPTQAEDIISEAKARKKAKQAK